MLFRNILFVLAVSLSVPAWAADSASASTNNNNDNDVIVKDAWTTETVPGQTKAILRMSVTCVNSYGKLVAVDSPMATAGTMEQLRPVHGRMAVQMLSAVALRHGRAMGFSERGVYLALKGLKQQLKVGDTVPVTLTILTAGKKVMVDVTVEVKPQDLSYKAYEDVELQKQR